MPGNYNTVGPGNLAIPAGFFVRRNLADTAWEIHKFANTKSDVSLGNADDTSDTNKPISTATQNALNLKEGTVAAGAASQYYRGDKSWQTMDKAAVGLSDVDDTSDADKPVSSAAQTALDAKQANITTGTTSQYMRGDLSLATFPSIPAAQVNSDWSSVAGSSQVLNKPSLGTAATQNTADFATAAQGAKADTAVQPGSLATVATTGSYNDLTNKPPVPPAASQSAATRSLNSAFQVSATRNASVFYSVSISNTLSLGGGSAGVVIFEIATNSGFTTGVQELGRISNSNTGTLVIGLTLVDATTQQVMGFVPAGYYARLRTSNTTGTPTYTYMSGQEVLL